MSTYTGSCAVECQCCKRYTNGVRMQRITPYSVNHSFNFSFPLQREGNDKVSSIKIVDQHQDCRPTLSLLLEQASTCSIPELVKDTDVGYEGGSALIAVLVRALAQLFVSQHRVQQSPSLVPGRRTIDPYPGVRLPENVLTTALHPQLPVFW